MNFFDFFAVHPVELGRQHPVDVGASPQQCRSAPQLTLKCTQIGNNSDGKWNLRRFVDERGSAYDTSRNRAWYEVRMTHAMQTSKWCMVIKRYTVNYL